MNFEIKTLKELGPNCPVGFVVGDSRQRNFKLKPFKLRDEKEFGALRDNAKNAKNMTFGAFVAIILSKMLTELGPHNFAQMSESDRRLIISQMSFSDVLYMYLYLRYEALGADEPVRIQAGCPHCKASFAFDSDLGSMEVKTIADSVKDATREYKLRDGLQIQRAPRSTLKLAPLSWGVFERRDFGNANRGEREAMTITGSIIGAEGVTMNPLVVLESDLDDLTKYDLEGLIRDIEDNSPGPIMVVDIDCESCGGSFKSMLDWTYDNFFSRYFRVSPGKT